MAISRWMMFIGILAVGTVACNNNPQPHKEITQVDSINEKTDSTDEAADDDIMYTQCVNNFFKGLPKFTDSLAATLQLQNGKKVSLTQFFKDEFMSPVSQYGRKDIDGDGAEELIIFNYTGGAHCCNEYFIFRQQSPDLYVFVSHLTGGQACIDPASNAIVYSLSESLGYFFSCYACTFPDSSDSFKPLREIQLVYGKSGLRVVPYDSITAKQNLNNLALLQQHGYVPLEGLMDNGWRKEYAINLAVWHYNHGKKLPETRKLFNRYYTFKDAPRVWNELQLALRDMHKENAF